MWHEARKQEKKIRGMMVDYKRRAERRREYYEKIKQDPAQFLQVHGRPAKIHLDPAVAFAADSPATMMPWQGRTDNMIDRFDVRAHLDIIPEYTPSPDPPKLTAEELIEDRKVSYERYRTLVQNDFLGVNEDKFLHQIYLEERFGPVLKPCGEEEKKKLMDKKAAIGYVYEDSNSNTAEQLETSLAEKFPDDEEDDDDEEKDDFSDIDLDITVDVNELTPAQCAEMNAQSVKYGMVDEDFITYLLQDKDEVEQLRLAREIEEEKAMYSGRKSRRERRALREKKLQGRKITSPPSYAARDSPSYTPVRRHSTSKSRSRSRSPPNAGKIMFITSFGGEGSDGEQAAALKSNLEKAKHKESSGKKSSKILRKPSVTNVVIGPQLPCDIEKKPKSGSNSYRRRNRSSSSSCSSTSRNDKLHKKRGKLSHDSRQKYRKSKHSPSSSSPHRTKSHSKKHKHKSRSRSLSSSRARSRSLSRSRSRSHSCPGSSKSRKKSRSRSRSRSASNTVRRSKSPQLPPPPVKSYYRHSLSRSGSEFTDDSDAEDKKAESSPGATPNFPLGTKFQPLMGKAGPPTKAKLTPQERLKRKMQIALNRQYKADKKAQMEKTEKQLQERMDRAEELREMAIKLRQRERERRHKMRGYDHDSDSDSNWSRSDHYGRIDDNLSSSQRERQPRSSSSSSSSSSRERRSTKTVQSKRSRRSKSRSRSRSKSSHRSPIRERKRSPLLWSSNQRRPESRTSPSRRRSPHRSQRRSPPRSPVRRRSPYRTSRSSYSRDDRRSPDSRDSQQQYSRGNFSSDSRSRSRSSRPLVDY